jgi:hypothetical protein
MSSTTKRASQRAWYVKNRASVLKQQRVWKAAHRPPRKTKKLGLGKVANRKDYDLRRLYGITLAEYEAMVKKQNGRCAICDEESALHVDHDHETGEVRGLLCQKCNTAIGHLRHDEHLLRRAIDYLSS